MMDHPQWDGDSTVDRSSIRPRHRHRSPTSTSVQFLLQLEIHPPPPPPPNHSAATRLDAALISFASTFLRAPAPILSHLPPSAPFPFITARVSFSGRGETRPRLSTCLCGGLKRITPAVNHLFVHFDREDYEEEEGSAERDD